MAMNEELGISIIIPVYNEVDNVAALYEEIVRVMSPSAYTFEVIFVDDGSKDGTVAKLRTLEPTSGSLRIVCHVNNCGQSAAILTGGRAAHYPVLVTLDGDGQNDPADILRLLEFWGEPNMVILGNRSVRHDSLVRKASSTIGNGVRRCFLRDECGDTGCSLKIFAKDVFLSLPYFDHAHRFLPALFKSAGQQLVNVPVNHRPRRYGQSKYGVMNRLFVGLHDLIGVRWLLSRTCNPTVCSDE